MHFRFSCLQGNVLETHSRWGGRPCETFIQNAFRNLPVKEFWKSVNISPTIRYDTIRYESRVWRRLKSWVCSA